MLQIRERLRKNGKKPFFVRIRMKGHPEATALFERLTFAIKILKKLEQYTFPTHSATDTNE